jgi:glycosyl hydrolase family 71
MTPLSVSALPFVMPNPFQGKPVFAHYFAPFPLSIDNLPALTDYYNMQYLTPGGENNIHLPYGGYLRQRPLAIPPCTAADWLSVNMQSEVQMAIARGISGFCYDILFLNDTRLQTLLAAAQLVDVRFKIIPMLDMNGLGTAVTPQQAAAEIASVAASPALYRVADGRIAMAAYDAPLQPLLFWSNVISILNAQGINVAFIPVLQGAASDAGTFDPISYALGAWGTVTPSSSAALVGNPAAAEAVGLKYMMPIGPQQFRPKSQNFWEAGNSAAFRAAWMAAISGDSDLVQVVTWSDFSESGQVQPYTDATLNPAIGTGFYDLTAYYATWFSQGVAPTITQDVLYFFYRRMLSSSAHPNQVDGFVAVGPPAEDNIEVLAFLTEPGVVKITTAGGAFGEAVPAGVTSFKVPSSAGIPVFALLRNGSNVFAAAGPVEIYGAAGIPSGVLDLTYWSGSVTQNGLTSYEH